MNTLKRYIWIPCLYLLFTGCTEKFVDLKNPTIASPDVIYSTLDGIESSLPGIYAQGRAYCTWERGSEYKNGPDDLCRAGIRLADEGAGGDYLYYQAYSLTSFDAENTFVRAIWETYYLGLHKCNLALEGLDNIEIANADQETRKNNASGVLYFFRAYFHLQLVQRFDNIVLADHVFNDPSEEITLASKDEVYSLIVSDLEKAITLLPDEWTVTTDKGHVTKGVARLVLAKACLDNGNWTRAASAADSVIFNNGGAYRLVGLDTVFNCHYRDNAEFIFSWQIHRPTSQTSMPVRFLPLYDRVRGLTRTFRYGGRPYDRLIPSDYYWTLFDKENDLRYQKWHILYYTYDTIGVGADNTEVPPPYVQIGDTVKEEDFTYDQGQYAPEQPGNEYINPTTNKWVEDDFFGRGIGDAYGGGNVLQYRLAEAYLCAAEAYWRLSQNQTAADRLNVLRERAGVDPFNSGDITLQTLLDEHAREMGQEGNRYEMLKRLGVLLEQVRLGNPDVGDIMQDFHVRWPIPYGFQHLTNVPQNDGYY